MRDPDNDEIYESDPSPEPEGDFEPASVEHLAVGNQGRLLDPRRTPIRITSIDRRTGLFEVEVLAFEDAGARWHVPLEEAWRFQMTRHSRRADGGEIGAYARLTERLDRAMTIECDPDVAARTSRRIESERASIRAALNAANVADALDPAANIEQRREDVFLIAVVRELLAERGLTDMDDSFARQYVSNPWSGELVKGHAIVLAELGVCPYRGKVVRDEGLFEGDWSKERRANHLISRLALTAVLWERAGSPEVTLYRAIAAESEQTRPAEPSFVSATFSRQVAAAHQKGVHGQAVPLRRLFMTFWETSAMNDRYREAEAILVDAPGGGF